MRKNVAAGRLKFTSSTADGVRDSDLIFIAVPTPPQPDGSVDLSFIDKIALRGLAFKQITDNVRESVAMRLARRMIDEVAELTAWDPEAIETAKRFGDLGDTVTYADNLLSCLDGADALVIGAEWSHFANADLNEIRKRMRTPLIFDGCNLFNPMKVAAAHIEYYSIGRPSLKGK